MKSAAARLSIISLAATIGISGASLAQGLKMQPGMWEFTSTTKSAVMPGMPPAAAKAMAGRTMTIHHCITAAEAAQGPLAAMKKNPSCSIVSSMQPNGRFTSNMMCKGPQGNTTITSSGTATPVSFSSESRMSTAGAQSMTIVSSSTGRRIGECSK